MECVNTSPGKALVVADALSRCSILPPACSDESKVEEIESSVVEITRTWPVSSQKLKEIALETARCPDMSLVHRFTQEGWPEYAKDVPVALKSYFASRKLSLNHQRNRHVPQTLCSPGEPEKGYAQKASRRSLGRQQVARLCSINRVVAYNQPRHQWWVPVLPVLRGTQTVEKKRTTHANSRCLKDRGKS